jgi:hypothetical protein
LNNNLRDRLQIGTLGAVSVGTGTVDITGTFTGYYDGPSVYNNMLNFSNQSLSIVLYDANIGGTNIAYAIDFPRVKFSTGDRAPPGINQDVMRTLNFQAFLNPSENVTMRISRLLTSTT